MFPKFMLNSTFFIILLPFLLAVCTVTVVRIGLDFPKPQVVAKADTQLQVVALVASDPFTDPYRNDQSSYMTEGSNYNTNHPNDYSALGNYKITFVQYSPQPPISMQQSPPTYTSPSPPLQSGPTSQLNQLSPLPSTTAPSGPSSNPIGPNTQQSGSPPLLVPPSAITRMRPANSSLSLPVQSTGPTASSSTPQFTGNSGTDLTPPETVITSVVDGINSTLQGRQVQQTIQPGSNTALSSMNPQSNATATTHSTKIIFTFAGTDNVAIAGFECSLDKPLPSPDSTSSALVSAFASNNVFSCSNRVVIDGLSPGNSHVFEVRAVDSSGLRDPSPAGFEWRVVNGSTTPVSSSQNDTAINNTPGNLTTSISTLNSNRAAGAQQQPQAFAAQLSGKDEVPPVVTQAMGRAQFLLSSDGKEIDYDLIATNLNGFMMAHIHQGKARENGQPIAPLQIGKGKITASDLQGPLGGRQISDLVNLIRNGQVYVNLHTQQNQNGEIRGQIMPG
jgi:hypothetical protein